MFLGWIVAGLTTTVIASSSAGIFGIAFLAPESPWFFVPVCIVCAIIGTLLHESKEKLTIGETLKKATIRAIFGALIGACATQYDWVGSHFSNGEFIVGAFFSFTISLYGKKMWEAVEQKILPSIFVFIKNWLERK
jgi:Na+/H+-translocating membrane pyrophosphatase